MSETVLLWFKRDLRVADHPALALAARLGHVLPLYILEPDHWRLEDVSARQFAFLGESVEDLRDQLAKIGLPLVLRVGDAVQTLEDLRRETGATQLVSHEETGNAWTFARDRSVAVWARGQGVHWREVPQCGVVRQLDGRDGWAARRNAFVREPLAELGQVTSPADIPASDSWRDLFRDDTPQRQKGGRGRGLRALDSFLTERGRTYRRAMSSPLEGARACSRLSPHLALGTLSLREVAQSAQAASSGADHQWRASFKSFQSRLAWRDHFIQKLEDQPDIETACLHRAYEGLRGDDPARRAAWEKGETGIPFVDACMRSLNSTGWLNFRMRSMLMAVASYHLWLDWRQTGLHLARMFTDYEPGIHWSQVQMQSGTTGMNTIRIYNPVKQGRDQDPTGAFTRRWLPELADVPDAVLQEPWRWEGAARLRYPAPIVDVAEAARMAREAVWAVRKSEGFAPQAARMVDRHASRKDREGHFVNDRSPRRRTAKADPRQMGFGF